MENHARCVAVACEDLSIDYRIIDKEMNLLVVEIKNKKYYFQHGKTSFNSEVVGHICRDKGHTYLILRDHIRIPKTAAILDWSIGAEYDKYVIHRSLDGAIDHVVDDIGLPAVVKPNRGALGRDVALCRSRGDAGAAITRIFDKGSPSYDYVAIAQTFIPTRKEYRLVCFDRAPLLAYERRIDGAAFKARYWEAAGGQCPPVRDEALLDTLFDFVRPVFDVIDVGFVGFDVIIGEDDQFYLIELNSAPRFNHYIQDNGAADVVDMYRTIFRRLAQKT